MFFLYGDLGVMVVLTSLVGDKDVFVFGNANTSFHPRPVRKIHNLAREPVQGPV